MGRVTIHGTMIMILKGLEMGWIITTAVWAGSMYSPDKIYHTILSIFAIMSLMLVVLAIVELFIYRIRLSCDTKTVVRYKRRHRDDR